LSVRPMAVALGTALLVNGCLDASAAPEDGATTADAASRPALKSNRWQEDWSPLGRPELRTEPLDSLKYISLSPDDPQSYLSLGATLRERFETNDAPAIGSGGAQKDSYLLQRLQVHADLHVNANLKLFTELEDARAFEKQSVSPVDQNRADLRLAFVEYDTTTALGTFKSRIGRQDFAFDLQRFVSSRDGPNVRQSFDAAWADWETGAWRFIGFVSRPVQYRDDHSFDDHSNNDIRFHTLRVERHVLGENELSAYYSLYERSAANYGDATGVERRKVFDIRFAGVQKASTAGLDWDLESMLQRGSVGAAAIKAWALGLRGGYTWAGQAWAPRAGLQVDVASGDSRRGDGTVGTFNPLFPNGYYFSLAGYTGYANLIHLKPSFTVKPMDRLSVMTAVAFLWRETTADAVYVQPNVPIANTAGKGGRRTGSYEQLRADYAVDRHVTCAVEAVHYQAADVLRAAGGRDSDYLGLEFKVMW
jgi:hypothetical protein